MKPAGLLIVSRGRPLHLVRGLSKGRQKVLLCTPEKALVRLEERPAEAVVVDGRPKQAQDFRLIGKIKSLHPGIPVIYLAESGSEHTAVQAFRTGARDYYRKPVNLYDLKRNVRRLIDLQKSAAVRRRPYVWSPAQTEHSLLGVPRNLPANLLRSLAYMEDHYDGDISLATLAEQAGMSKYHFCRAFKAVMGESPVRHLIRIRIGRAKVILRTTSLTISDISSLVGFNDLGNFSRTFKRWCSHSPSRFRKMHPSA